MLTAHALHLFIPSTVYFDSPNQFHVHMYISHWGSEEQSPSLEINFDSRTSCTQCPAHLASISTCLTKEVETSEPMQTLSPLPLPCSSTHTCTDLAAPSGNPLCLHLCPPYAGHNIIMYPGALFEHSEDHLLLHC